MHHLNIKPEAKPVKQQQQQRFWPDIMEAIKTKIHKLIECGFIREKQHPDWVANINVPVLKKNGKTRVCIDFHDLNVACPKDKFSLPITDVMIDNTFGFKRMSFWMAFQDTTKSKCIRMTKNIHHFEHRWDILLHGDAFWLEKHQCSLSKCNEHNFLWSSAEDGEMLYRRHRSQKS